VNHENWRDLQAENGWKFAPLQSLSGSFEPCADRLRFMSLHGISVEETERRPASSSPDRRKQKKSPARYLVPLQRALCSVAASQQDDG